MTKQQKENDIEETYKRIKPLVERMKAKYPKELNIEGLEPALTNDIAEIVLKQRKDLQREVKKELEEMKYLKANDKQSDNDGKTIYNYALSGVENLSVLND